MGQCTFASLILKALRQLLFFCLLVSTAALVGQSSRNPFELTDRLPTVARLAEDDSAAAGNPFDVYPVSERDVVDSGPVVVRSQRVADGSGIVFIHLLLLVILASLWVLFRDLLQRCFAAIFNDNVMTELYRRRSGGQVGALWLCYLLFLLSAGCYLYLFTRHYAVGLGLGMWGSWLTYTLLVAGALGVKLVVLTLLGRIFPLRKELSQYAFALMVFSILTGLLLVPINLLVSYAPDSWQPYFLFGGLLVLFLIYLLHLLRGLFIANRYVGSRPLHFLLYICTIEIAPVLLIYRYLSNTLQ